jgi:ABC-type molybdate transport system substrate-binding protein
MLLHALVANANKDGEVSYYDDALKEGLSKAHWNGNFVESKLWELNESDVIAFEMYGEEGFRPLVVLNIKPATYVRLADRILETGDHSITLVFASRIVSGKGTPWVKIASGLE